jgi:glycerophosphoryl diester phosphodiesterase
LIDKSGPLVVAHRGASARCPENTLEAFEAAVSVGADVVELDVRLTADGVPVILHDYDVSRTTEGVGMVHDLTLRELKRLDVSGGRGPRAEIPTLRESLELLAGRVLIDIELKNVPGEPSFDSPEEELATRVVGIVADLRLEGAVLFSSFNWLSIERVRELDSGAATGFLTVAGIDPLAALAYSASAGHGYVLPQAIGLWDVGADLVRAAHEIGVRVGTWTVDAPEQIQALFSMGVDAVATNDPEAAIPIRDRIRAERGG